MIQLSPFLSAYDPSDLPGSSIDPLGFERGYLLLAEKLLPGLTNVASKPRYFGVLCAGVQLAESSAGDPPRMQYQRRLDTVLRFERLWALANVLVAADDSDDEYPVGGIRGLRYAQAKAASLRTNGDIRTTSDFPLLIRQMPYGVVGIYAAVAERLRFVHDRKTLALTPDLGERLASAFLEETNVPADVYAAIRKNTPVAVDRLRAWGKRAHISGTFGREEGLSLSDAYHWNDTRSRFATLLGKHSRMDQESELDRLARILTAIRGGAENRDIAETLEGICTFEKAYATAQLGLERLLWLCGHRASVPIADTRDDKVLGRVRRDLPAAVRKLNRALNDAGTEPFTRDLHRLNDVKAFLGELSGAAERSDDFVDIVLRRHADVQRGKFDRGRRKAPWIEADNGKLSLTTTRVGGASVELSKAAEVIPHYYRTTAADALRLAGSAE